MHKQLNDVDRDHAARQRSYLHEELGPGGGALHHAIHHTDESLTLTHLQQRKERMIQTQTHIEISPPHPPGLAFQETGEGGSPWGFQHSLSGLTHCSPLVNSISGPALKLPLRKSHGRELGGHCALAPSSEEALPQGA